jgi:hypothetical protein
MILTLSIVDPILTVITSQNTTSTIKALMPTISPHLQLDYGYEEPRRFYKFIISFSHMSLEEVSLTTMPTGLIDSLADIGTAAELQWRWRIFDITN